MASAYLSAELYPAALELMGERGSPLVYVDCYDQDMDILVEKDTPTHPFQEEYLGDHGAHARVRMGLPRYSPRAGPAARLTRTARV